MDLGDLSSVDLCTIPAGKSPDGIYNFEDPETLGPTILAIGVILCTISVVSVIGRIHINWRKLGAADYFTIAACIFNIGFTGIQLSSWRMYRHQWDIPVCWFTPAYFKTLFVQECFFFPVYFLSKAAIFLLYRQLFGIKRWMRIAVNIGILITFALYFPNIPLAAVYSAPRVGEPWSSILTSTGPHKMITFGIVMAAVSTLLDLYIFSLPIPVIVNLQMPFERRVQLVGIFATAFVGVIASILSLVYRVALLNTADAVWPQSIVSICALIESNVAIIVGCMPAFSQLWRTHIGGSSLFRSLRSRLRGKSSLGSNGSGDKDKISAPGMVPWNTSPPPARMKNNYEMSDTNLLQSQVTSVGNGPAPMGSSHDGILRSVGISQHWQLENDSRERLA